MIVKSLARYCFGANHLPSIAYLCPMAETLTIHNTSAKNIRQMSLAGLEDFFLNMGEKKFRASQVWEWLWQKHAHSFADMTNLSKELREKLGQHFFLPALVSDASQYSSDGTVKTPKNTTFFNSRKVEPGGTLIVPPKGPKKDYLDAMAKITQIIYQIAISVGVAVTVF